MSSRFFLKRAFSVQGIQDGFGGINLLEQMLPVNHDKVTKVRFGRRRSLSLRYLAGGEILRNEQ
jgi:hypothetical protein